MKRWKCLSFVTEFWLTVGCVSCGQSALDCYCLTVDRNPFSSFLAWTMSNCSEGKPVKGHLDRSLTSRHHASSGTDSLLPKTNAYKPTEIKRQSIIKGPVLSGTTQIVWCSESTRTPIHTLWKWDMPTSFHSQTRSMSGLDVLRTGNSHMLKHIY